MIWVLIISWLSVAALAMGWGLLGDLAMFPLGAVAAVACLYFSWAETLVWVFSLSLLVESFLPLTPGSVAIPLTMVTLGLQLLARHQFRSGLITKMFLAFLLQSLVTVIFALQWPPRTVAGVVEQMVGALTSGVSSAILCVLGSLALMVFSRHKGDLDLESRLKDL